MRTVSVKLITALALAGMLAACGVRGSLERPAASATDPGTPTPATSSGEPSTDKPHQPSALDKLLR